MSFAVHTATTLTAGSGYDHDDEEAGLNYKFGPPDSADTTNGYGYEMAQRSVHAV